MKSLIRKLYLDILAWRANRCLLKGNEQGYVLVMREIRALRGKDQVQ